MYTLMISSQERIVSFFGKTSTHFLKLCCFYRDSKLFIVIEFHRNSLRYFVYLFTSLVNLMDIAK